MKKNLKNSLLAKVVCGAVLASLCLSPFASLSRASDVPDTLMSTADFSQVEAQETFPNTNTADANGECGRLNDGESCQLTLLQRETKGVYIETARGARVTSMKCSIAPPTYTDGSGQWEILKNGTALRGNTVYKFNVVFGNCTVGLQAN